MGSGDYVFVDAQRLERRLAQLRADAGNPIDGLFGPGSMTWRVNREAILFLGAGRAALLQTAHPWVGAAIDQQSTTKADPIGRFHRTFTVVFSMVFGSVDQATAMARRLHRVHGAIGGQLDEATGPFKAGSPYYANEIEALRWVYATLVDTSVKMYELVFPPLTDREKADFYKESIRFAGLYGLAPTDLPEDWRAFNAYMDETYRLGLLEVKRAAREMGDFLMSGKTKEGRRNGPAIPHWYRAVTSQFLPAPLRAGYGLPFEGAERQAAASGLRWIRRTYPHLPTAFRYVPAYLEALGRIDGRARPDFLTRKLNRFWVGRAQLVS